MGVWEKAVDDSEVNGAAWRGEWGRRGRDNFEDYRERVWDRELAACEAAQRRAIKKQNPGVVRHLVFGVLAIEGLVALLTGLAIMLMDWPPLKNGRPANRVAYIGLGVCILSVGYLMIVAGASHLWALLRPVRRDWRVVEERRKWLEAEELPPGQARERSLTRAD